VHDAARPLASPTLVRPRAHAAAAHLAGGEGTAASDDVGLVECLGGEVRVVAGEVAAMKITTARDLAVAELLLAEHRG